jgi:hypothetical protein
LPFHLLVSHFNAHFFFFLTSVYFVNILFLALTQCSNTAASGKARLF